MKKLGKLNLKPEKMLSHEELVNSRGGSGIECTYPKSAYKCQCIPGVGTWYTCATSHIQAENAGEQYCEFAVECDEA